MRSFGQPSQLVDTGLGDEYILRQSITHYRIRKVRLIITARRNPGLGCGLTARDAPADLCDRREQCVTP